jgi:hypothetical protein
MNARTRARRRQRRAFDIQWRQIVDAEIAARERLALRGTGEPSEYDAVVQKLGAIDLAAGAKSICCLSGVDLSGPARNRYFQAALAPFRNSIPRVATGKTDPNAWRDITGVTGKA